MTGSGKGPYDRDEDGELVLKGTATPRPKDAATLILVRPTPQGNSEVLMGKRSGRHSFMPDKYVFPGGGVDAPDGRVPTASELSSQDSTTLAIGTRRRPRAFALTAIRETFEETGLIVGVKDDRANNRPPPPAWLDYFALGAAPCLQNLTFIGRAITPPYRPKRFDARFFMADARRVLIDDRPPMDGAELSDLQWVGLEDAQNLDLPSVTRFMLGEIAERCSSPTKHLAPPFLRWTRSGHQMHRFQIHPKTRA